MDSRDNMDGKKTKDENSLNLQILLYNNNKSRITCIVLPLGSLKGN